jgi:hypothetical protein
VFILKILLFLSFPFSTLIFVMSVPSTHFLVCTKYIFNLKVPTYYLLLTNYDLLSVVYVRLKFLQNGLGIVSKLLGRFIECVKLVQWRKLRSQ